MSGEMTAEAQAIDGVWIMRGMSTTFADGHVEDHPEAEGELIYSASLGTVFAHIVRLDSRNPDGRMNLGYCGLFEITGPDSIVHHVAASTNKKVVGKDLARTFKLSADGKTLLITGSSAEHQGAIVNIEWRKFERH